MKLLLLLILIGCTPTYKVEVSRYSELDDTVFTYTVYEDNVRKTSLICMGGECFNESVQENFTTENEQEFNDLIYKLHKVKK